MPAQIIVCNLPNNTHIDNAEVIFKTINQAIEQHITTQYRGAFFNIRNESIDESDHFQFLLRELFALPDEIEILIGNFPQANQSEIFKDIKRWITSQPRKHITAYANELSPVSYSSDLAGWKKQLRVNIEKKIIEIGQQITTTSSNTAGVSAIVDPTWALNQIVDLIYTRMFVTKAEQHFIDYCSAFYYQHIAGYYSIHGLYTKANQYYNEAIKIIEPYTQYPLCKTWKISLQKNKARVLKDQGEYVAAIAELTQLKSELEAIYGENSFMLSDVENEILLCNTKCNNNSLFQQYTIASARTQEWYGNTSLKTATVWDNEASYLLMYGHYTQAENLYLKAANIYEEKQIKNSNYASILNNLAATYCNQKKYVNALRLYQQSLEIYTEVLGEFSPDCANVLNNIATLYSDQKKYDDALTFYSKALVIIERTSGANHPKTATIVNNIASLYNRQKKYDLAIALYKRSLIISEKKLGPDHLNVASTLNNLGAAYYYNKEYDLAEECLIKSISIREIQLGLNHQHTQITQSWINLLNHAIEATTHATAAAAATPTVHVPVITTSGTQSNLPPAPNPNGSNIFNTSPGPF